jgi:hypothetical protein
VTSPIRGVATVLVSAALLLGTAALSWYPYEAEARPDGVVRFSWRTRGEVIENCRRPGQAELDKMPAHLRQEVVCQQGTVAPYRLRIVVGEMTLLDSLAPGSGGRSDRPMYLLREVRIAAGSHRLVVELRRDDRPEGTDDSTQVEAEGGSRRALSLRQRAIPRRMTLDTVVTLGAREVALVTYDSEKRRLVVVHQ